MMQPRVPFSPRSKARVAGLLYLIVIVGGIFAELFVRGRLIAHGDAVATAHNIVAHQLLYRMGFAVEVFYCACNLPLILIFYDLFKAVSRTFAVLVVFFSLVGTAVESVSLLCHFAPLVLLGSQQYLNAFTTEQLQDCAYLSIKLFESGFAVALVFFGFYCLCFGYLIIRSTFFPRVIGTLLSIQGLCYLLNSFATFLAPAFAARFFSYLMISGMGEVFLCLWLLVVGVNASRWQEASAA
jgi:hypothetical protein